MDDQQRQSERTAERGVNAQGAGSAPGETRPGAEGRLGRGTIEGQARRTELATIARLMAAGLVAPGGMIDIIA